MFKVLLILIGLCFEKEKGKHVDRVKLKKKILAGCVEMSSAVADKKQLICKCILDNFDKKLNDHQLKLVSANYIGQKVETTDKEYPGSAIQTFDYEVATACVENPAWRANN